MELNVATQVLESINHNHGSLWEKIDIFRKQLMDVEGYINHDTEEMEKTAPVHHHIEGGLYTREVCVPQGGLVVSFIHKQSHPSFLLKGEVSYLDESGEVNRIKAPYKILTKEGAQRVFYIHKNTTWCCVFKTEAKTVKEAEKDVFTLNYKELPKKIIDKKLKLCQE
jgi:hypothetical protein